MSPLNPPRFSGTSIAALSFAVTLTFLGVAPFSLAQDVEHIVVPPPSQSAETEEWNRQLNQHMVMEDLGSDYLLGPGDVIDIKVFGAEQFSERVEIGAGKITLPFLDQIQVVGLSTRELEKKLESLLSQTVLVNPQVTVRVVEFRSQPIYVIGEVKAPGQHYLRGQARLIDALAMAGGLLRASGRIQIYRAARTLEGRADGHRAAWTPERPGSSKTETIEVDLEELLLKRNAAANVPIFPGDVIKVPRQPELFYYLLGAVRTGGSFQIAGEDTPVRITEALARAGGLDSNARPKVTKILRRNERGDLVQIDVDVDAILKGKAEDVFVRANDLVFLPSNKTKKVGLSLLAGSVAGFVTNSLYWLVFR